MESYDVLVIGGGTAGLVTAAGAASLGARTALVERDRLGGECLWTGCVPSKGLVSSARLAEGMRRAARYGLPAREPEVDGSRVLESVREVRSRIQPHDDPDRFREMGVDVLEGAAARFVSPRAVEADGRRLEARRVVVATGSRPAVPPVEGLEEAGYVTHETAFDRERLPDSAVVLGGGPIGVEFAQAYRRLGVDVTLVEMEDRILPAEDPEVAERLQEILRDEGIRVLTGHRAEAAGRRDDLRSLRVVLTGSGGPSPPDPAPETEETGSATEAPPGAGRRELTAREIFVATGRRPNVEGLNLDAAGVEFGPGGIRVDGKLRTTHRRIYAAGDVVGGHLFTHVADHEARTVIRNVVAPVAWASVDYSVVPWAIYSDPELARVGLTEEEARERHGDDVEVYRYDLTELDRAVTERAARGLVKLVTDGRGRLVGGHVLAPEAGTMIVEVALAMKADARISDLADLIHPYPTMSEGVRRAAHEYYRGKLTDRALRWLERYFRWLRRLGV